MDEHEIAGDEPAVDGMRVAVRIRRDFTVTDARRLLAAARAAYLDGHPGASDLEAEQMVTSAADGIFTLLEQDGLSAQRSMLPWLGVLIRACKSAAGAPR